MKPTLKPQTFPFALPQPHMQRVVAVLDLLTFPWKPDDPVFAARDSQLMRETRLKAVLREAYSGEYSGIADDESIKRVPIDVGANFCDIFEIVLKAPRVWVAVEASTTFPTARPVWHGNAFFATRDHWFKPIRSEPTTKIAIADVPNAAATAVLIADCSHRGEAGPEITSFAKLICQKLHILGDPAPAVAMQ